MSLTTPVYTYSAAALAYAAFALLLALRGARSWQMVLLAVAALATAGWAASVVLTELALVPAWVMELAAPLRDGCWFGVVLAVLYPKPGEQGRRVWAALAVATAAILVIHAFFAVTAFDAGLLMGIRVDANATAIMNVVMGLILVENMMRNLTRDQFWSAKYLGIGLLCILAFQLLVRLPEFLTHTPAENLLAARPLVYLVALPLFVVTAVRSPALQLRVHSSRRIVFHTTALLAAGVILEGTALAAYYVRTYGGDNGTVLSVVLGFAGVVAVAVAVASASVRSRLRAFINENFFSYKYDYRHEWDKFIRSLSALDEGDIPLKVLRTLAEVVDSPGGALWLLRDSWRQYLPVATWSFPPELAPVAMDDEGLAAFADEDCAYLELTAVGDNPSSSLWHQRFPAAWLAVPLRYRSALIGVAVLNKPRAERELDWEDRNLIKLVALQLAAYLVQEETAQALADTRQLEEFNKRFAFILHDIKNTVGQLNLLVRNAERFGDDADFRKDMVLTLRHSVEKLQELLAQLKTDTAVKVAAAAGPSTDVVALVDAVAAEKRRLGLDVVVVNGAPSALAEVADTHAFLRVLEHVITNAVEAAPQGSPVQIRIGRHNGSIRVSVDDRGPGMTQQFIANELFRPLRTTKRQGFGIGAYQAREIMRELGGDIAVNSTLGKGTTVALSLPASEAEEKVGAR